MGNYLKYKRYAAYSCKITHKSKSTLSDIRSFIHATFEKQIPEITWWYLQKSDGLRIYPVDIWLDHIITTTSIGSYKIYSLSEWGQYQRLYPTAKPFSKSRKQIKGTYNEFSVVLSSSRSRINLQTPQPRFHQTKTHPCNSYVHAPVKYELLLYSRLWQLSSWGNKMCKENWKRCWNPMKLNFKIMNETLARSCSWMISMHLWKTGWANGANPTPKAWKMETQFVRHNILVKMNLSDVHNCYLLLFVAIQVQLII